MSRIEELMPRDRIIVSKVYFKINQIINMINEMDDRIKVLENKTAVK